MLSIGLMSGTSMDGIDAALLETDGSSHLLKEKGHSSLSYKPAFKLLLKAAEYTFRKFKGQMQAAEAGFEAALHEYLSEELNLSEASLKTTVQDLTKYLAPAPLSLSAIIQHSTELHAQVVNDLIAKSSFQRGEIDVIGYHGQTMFHQPSEQISVIVGEGQVLANQVGVTVVNDFRRLDLSYGGQGAPFAPLYHQALALRDHKVPLAVVNCGGIANLTLIRNSNPLDLLAFDTGPGNGLIDRLIRKRTAGREAMDKDGHYGKNGTPNPDVLNALYEKAVLQDGRNYFAKAAPKALDSGDLKLIPELESLSLEDACATLEAFTAETIVSSLTLLNTPFPQQWILAGGGWHNPVICQYLVSALKKLDAKVSILKADEAGWNNQALEAQIFAFHAVRSLKNQALSVPGTTGVIKPVSGGQAYLPLSGATQTVLDLIQKNPAVLSGYL